MTLKANMLAGASSLAQQQPIFSGHRMMPQQQQREQDPAAGGGGGGGGQPLDYSAAYGALSPENKEFVTRKGFDKGGEGGKPLDINGVYDNLRSLEKLVGKNNLAPPDMTQDDPLKSWETGRKALGILDKPEDYKLTRKNMPNGLDGKPMPYDEEGEKVFRQAIAGVVPEKYADKVFAKLQDMQIARQAAYVQQQKDDKDATEKAIATHWGKNRDEKIARATVIADRLGEQLGIEPAELKNATNSMLGSWPMLKMMDFLADQFAEGFIKDGKDGGGDPTNENTPAGAKAALARLDTDPAFKKAREDRSDPGHKAAVDRYNRLFQTSRGG